MLEKEVACQDDSGSLHQGHNLGPKPCYIGNRYQLQMHPHLPRSPPPPHRRTEPPPKLASCVPGASHQPCIVLSEQHEVDIQVPWRSVLRSISLGIRIH
ncbi:uncharacterized protein QC764_701350 [Podospora pseudoanserina]|uniref:Uncharacterized protein n=1 Tax=Podospora pseudoanserina TaxID=2609844 RepID=A0ABR0HLW3_9PEZI|nr:hypothetical protein QC764_701350 [Podospora pseudoanserina]